MTIGELKELLKGYNDDNEVVITKFVKMGTSFAREICGNPIKKVELTTFKNGTTGVLTLTLGNQIGMVE